MEIVEGVTSSVAVDSIYKRRKLMRLKITLVLMSLLCILSGSTMKAMATENIEDARLEREYITVNIYGNDKEMPIYKDREAVLSYINEKYTDVLEYIKDKYRLSDLSMDTWEDFNTYVNLEDQKLSLEDAYGRDICDISKIFDIFENDMYIEESGMFYKANYNPQPRTTIGIDLDAAIAYATKYATSPNKKEYKYFDGGDCTNFVSQILEAGGIEQEEYDDKNSGWWHKKESGMFGVKHKYSISFIRASTFANYMGVSYDTSNHFDFSNELEIGDIIGYDKDYDGDWNHMAFVTDKRDRIINKNGRRYYDYKVAQHTGNYHKWVSDKDNHWEEIEEKGYGYGIIRR